MQERSSPSPANTFSRAIAVAVANLGEQAVLDKRASGGGQVADAALIKIGEDLARLPASRSLRRSSPGPAAWKCLALSSRQTDVSAGWLDFQLFDRTSIFTFGSGCGDEADDAGGNARVDQAGRPAFRQLRPLPAAGHAMHAVLHDAADERTKLLELGQEVFAEGEDDLAVRARGEAGTGRAGSDLIRRSRRRAGMRFLIRSASSSRNACAAGAGGVGRGRG